MYQLIYWPGLPGRAEYVRLILEFLSLDYLEVSRLTEEEGGGSPAVIKIRNYEHKNTGFAPPYLRDGNLLLAQSVNISEYLAMKHGLVSKDEKNRAIARQYALTIADVTNEVHDTHHPLDMGDYYENQKEAALIRANAFIKVRLPRFITYFDHILTQNNGTLGPGFSYADLHLFHLISGLQYAFPQTTSTLLKQHDQLLASVEDCREHPNLRNYLQSPRRIPFNEHGIFRHYPELEAQD